MASVSSRSAGPGTRANIDEFTETTARGIETVGGAERGKAIIVLNPADPPIIMRDTIFTLSQGATPEDVAANERSWTGKYLKQLLERQTGRTKKVRELQRA